MPPDTQTAGKNAAMPPDPTRTYRLSDELYAAAQELAWQRRDRSGVAGVAALAVHAWVLDPDALEAACRQIIGENT